MTDTIPTALEDIMASRNVGRRRAYALLREAQEKAVEPVESSQREAVLRCLVEDFDGRCPEAAGLSRALQARGLAKFDFHDATKVLWSLQKTQDVQFRQRPANHRLYAIRVTEHGHDTYAVITKTKVKADAPGWGPHDHHWATYSDTHKTVTRCQITGCNAIKEAEFRVPVEADPNPSATRPSATRPGEWGSSGAAASLPLITELRTRAMKAGKLAVAARMLEEAGEDDLALAALEKTKFTPLEEEVVNLLGLIGAFE